MWRIGPRPTEQQLRPREYEAGSGTVRATLRSVESGAEVDEVLSSWRYEGVPLSEVPFMRNANGRFSKEHTALVGVWL